MLSTNQIRFFDIPSPLENLNIKIYKTIILPVVLYRCESLSLTLREEHIEGV